MDSIQRTKSRFLCVRLGLGCEDGFSVEPTSAVHILYEILSNYNMLLDNYRKVEGNIKIIRDEAREKINFLL